MGLRSGRKKIQQWHGKPKNLPDPERSPAGAGSDSGQIVSWWSKNEQDHMPVIQSTQNLSRSLTDST
uniref:Uncharacterized protein n=1 Tax=Rhizophora mucronata TaxID=61149 RepID=A0A2P2JV64_RHIMU